MTFFGTKIQNFLSFKIVLAFHSIGFLKGQIPILHDLIPHVTIFEQLSENGCIIYAQFYLFQPNQSFLCTKSKFFQFLVNSPLSPQKVICKKLRPIKYYFHFNQFIIDSGF